jgi:hypothetical protein
MHSIFCAFQSKQNKRKWNLFYCAVNLFLKRPKEVSVIFVLKACNLVNQIVFFTEIITTFILNFLRQYTYKKDYLLDN